jgi:hypothetical protein
VTNVTRKGGFPITFSMYARVKKVMGDGLFFVTNVTPHLRLLKRGSPHCAGCYGVGHGRKIHPPKSSVEWLVWLERWEGRGKAQ